MAPKEKLTAEKRLAVFERIYVRYPRSDQLFEKIDYCRVHSKIAKDPDCLLIMGEQGAGKTSLAERYEKKFSRRIETRIVDGMTKVITVVPVLLATCPTKATEKSLVETFLTALGDTEANKGNLTTQTLRLCKYIEACETEILIVDEFQHFQDRDRNKILKNVANYLKEIIIRTNKPMILTGMPYSVGILDDNPQLNRRFKRASLDPLKWEPPPQKEDVQGESEFKVFLSYLDDEISSVFGKRSDLADETTALAFYTATAGNIDRLMRVIHLAAARALDYEREKLDSNVLAEAYEVELRAERPKEENPFGEWTGPSTKPPANGAVRGDGMNKRIKAKQEKPTAGSLVRGRK
jgi:hypothetical protein